MKNNPYQFIYFTEGVISYSVIQGDIKDTGYDGREEGGILVGGIGQLCDGRHGVDQPFMKSAYYVNIIKIIRKTLYLHLSSLSIVSI